MYRLSAFGSGSFVASLSASDSDLSSPAETADGSYLVRTVEPIRLEVGINGEGEVMGGIVKVDGEGNGKGEKNAGWSWEV